MIDQLHFCCGYCLLDLSADFAHMSPNQAARCPRCRAYYLGIQTSAIQDHDQVIAVVHAAAKKAGVAVENIQMVIRYGCVGGEDLPQVSFWEKSELLAAHEITAVLNLNIDQAQILLQQGSIEASRLVGDDWVAPRWAVQKYRILGEEREI